jgi:hypothetical protein
MWETWYIYLKYICGFVQVRTLVSHCKEEVTFRVFERIGTVSSKLSSFTISASFNQTWSMINLYSSFRQHPPLQLPESGIKICKLCEYTSG